MAEYYTTFRYKDGKFDIELFQDWKEEVEGVGTSKVWMPSVYSWRPSVVHGVAPEPLADEIFRALNEQSEPRPGPFFSPFWWRLADAKRAVKRAVQRLPGKKRWGLIEWDEKWHRK
jgi:hypothetical protein